MSIAAEGWGFPGASRKAHYFLAGDLNSLCGRWAFSGERTPADGSASPDDCAECSRRLARRAAAEVGS